MTLFKKGHLMRTEREKTREARKLDILVSFTEEDTQYTNQVAKKIGVVWPVADRLLRELVREGKLTGDKVKGYRLYEEPIEEPKKDNFFDKVKSFLHIK